MTILFVTGVNDRSMVAATLDDQGRLAHVFDGNLSIEYKIRLKPGISAHALLFGPGVKQRELQLPRRPSLIVNQIADADTHRGSLQRCAELCGQLGAPVINRPELVLRTTRERMAESLTGIPGVTMPRTVRFRPGSPDDVFAAAAAGQFDFPFIVRVAGDHGGTSTVRVCGREDYGQLHIYPFDGRDFYLTQYIEYRNREGLYHKQRIAVVDGEPLLRHALFDAQWLIHAASRQFMRRHETWEDGHRRMRHFDREVIPAIRPAIEEITRRVKLDIYGIDCCIRAEHDMLLFEANANMNILFNEEPQMAERVAVIERSICALLSRRSGEAVT